MAKKAIKDEEIPDGDNTTVQTINKSDKTDLKKLLTQMGDGVIGRRLAHLIKSRYKILYIRSQEEMRVVQCMRWISLIEGYDLYQWDCSRGLLDAHSKQQVKANGNEIHENPNAVLGHIIEHANNDNKKLRDKKITGSGHIYMLLDYHPFLRDNPEAQRKFKEFFNIPSVCCIVIVSPVFECPETLEKEFTLIDFPFPSKDELKSALTGIKKEISTSYPKAIKYAEDHEEELLDAAAGLTVIEAENAYALSLVKDKMFNITTITDEKQQIIRKGGILEYRNPKFSFDDIGGLDTLKIWLSQRKTAFSKEAREFGLAVPKGALLCGVPGVGKSMTCDALAHHWQMPLLRLDMGSVYSSHVGDSEKNMRSVIQTAEAIAPVILWVDEIEKGIGGIESSNQTDGGVTNRIFGTFLTWMQEKTASVFVVCTANNVTSIPPEFMRAGRFDEIFFLDLPNADQRRDVLERLLFKKSRNPDEFNLDKIVSCSEHYSPAELEKAINNALFVSFCDSKRKLTTDDIINEINKFQPLYVSRFEEIDKMRSWALGENGSGGRAVLANSSGKSPGDFSIFEADRSLDLSENDV